MSALDLHQCECSTCQQPPPHPDQALHGRINLLLSRLDEQQRRWYVAMEADRAGPGGDAVLAQITGMDAKTIQRGRQELESSLAERPRERVRLPGGGRPHAEKRRIARNQFGDVGSPRNGGGSDERAEMGVQ